MSEWIDKWIEAEWLKELYKPYESYNGKELAVPIGAILANIDDAPSIDIVRCQDCKYWVYNFNGCSRNPCTEPWYATDGCTYGEREGE